MTEGQKRCSGQTSARTHEIPLPVIDGDHPPLGKVRASRNGRRRAWVLGLLNLVMVLHVLQWWWSRRTGAGWTISPIEPSETVYTLTQGFINAGFIFFVLAMIATAVFGRFVCGWGCHVVALQDLCAWLMKKCGIRPRAFRSRLLMLVPLLAGLYMFVWPLAYRAWQWAMADQPLLPPLTNHLLTRDFWKTFPGMAIAIPFLLICGFATVYFLGSKGFCTYACPYGGMFAVADKFARGRIRVTNDCEQCGHCTAVCTSNVQVHAEVRDYGMVIDPGCMKCLDCVSVCPNQALYFGFGPTPLTASPRVAQPAKRRFDLTHVEEGLAVAVFLWAFLAFRGIYGAVPFLLALAVAGIFAFLMWKTINLCRSDHAVLQGRLLKQGGHIRPAGWLLLLATSGLALLTLHSSLIQYHGFMGRRDVAQTPPEEQVLSGEILRTGMSPSQQLAAQEGLRHFQFCDRWGLLSDAETKLRLSWFEILAQNWSAAESHLRQAATLAPDQPMPRFYLARTLYARGRYADSTQEFDQAHQFDPDNLEIRFHRGNALAALGRLDEAMADWQAVALADANRAPALHNLAGAYRQLGRFTDAIAAYERVLQLMPDDAASHFFLAVALTQAGRSVDGLPHFRRAVELQPRNAEFNYQLGLSLLEAGQLTDAARHLQEAARLDPRFLPPS